MIFLGTKRVTTSSLSGTFPCPQCTADRVYLYQKVRKYIVLLSFPVFPLHQLGEYIECEVCKGTFVPQILDVAIREADWATLSVYDKAMRHTMVLMLLADGEVDGNELDTVLEIVNSYGHRSMSMVDLEVFVEQVRRSPQPLGTYLRRVAPTLNDHGKEKIIRCAMAVASADGKIARVEVEVIQEMAHMLGLSRAALHAIINPESVAVSV